MFRAVVFDLDDTLYDEMSFVASGFRAAARCAQSAYGVSEEKFFEACMQAVRERGRGQVFNIVLANFGLQTPERVAEIIDVYRSHRPSIHLDRESVEALRTLREMEIPSGIITDGLASVQRNKVKSLGLDTLVDFILYTGDLGSEFSKPHVKCFEMALKNLRLKAKDVVYVGNDENKDFLGAHRIGMTTIKVAKREIRMRCAEPGYQAMHTVESIADVIPFLFSSAKEPQHGKQASAGVHQ